jgi:hypothetical protein
VHTQTSAQRHGSNVVGGDGETMHRGRLAAVDPYDIGDTRAAAWSYRAPFEAVARIADLVSFYPEKMTIAIYREKLEPAPGQNVISHGPDRNLSVDEIGGIQPVEDAAAET